ncbi:M20/M25/M40 family metallo-hydrolase [Planctomycetota bacterium]|nr:M20/M25/M40 family metallo-hydrolase [Planctomycetota bacterium]
MKKTIPALVPIFAILAATSIFSTIQADEANSFQSPNLDSITVKDIKSDVYFLASDAMRGRETRRPEAAIAAEYVASRFKRAGLKPAGEEGGWLQTVKLQYRDWSEQPALSVTHNGGKPEKILYESGFVSTGGASGELDLKGAKLAFAGYAITDATKKYDDLAGVDLKGKIAVILRYEPTPWRKQGQRNPFSRNSHLRTKARLLKAAGAAAIMMVTGPESVANQDSNRNLPSPKAAEESPPLALALPEAQARASGSLPFFQVTLEAADALLGGKGETLRLQQAFDGGDFTARPDFKNSRVDLTAKSELSFDECHNVAGMIEGKTDEWVIFGAHHDHLGFGYFGARDASKGGMGKIHNGADDNASGVSTVLEIAEAYAESGIKPNRNFLFLTFTGEEKGLLGSSWYVKHPLVPHDKVAAMINIDMIGRLKDHKVALTGTSCSKVLDSICKKAAPLFPGLDVQFSERPPMAASDHWPFYKEAGIPVFFPFGGMNDFMHTAEDDAETINYEDLHKAIRLLSEIGWRISENAQKPDYIGPVKRPVQPETKPEPVPEPKPPEGQPAEEEDFSR